VISYSRLKHRLVGELLLLADDTDLFGVYYGDHGIAPAIERDWQRNPNQPVLAKAARQIEEYLDGKRKTFSLRIRLNGTPFQRNVWERITEIPYGKTVSFSELAARAKAPRAVRAVGAACGMSPFEIIIPTHRVISKDSGYGGYAGLWNRKKGLLDLEGIAEADLVKRPKKNNK
jgi:methylated-DNA-[protein]-cysteine S-methyltransferase